jgi:hypothetical protein
MGIVSKTAFRFLRDVLIAIIAVVGLWVFAVIYTTSDSSRKGAFFSHVRELLAAHEQLHAQGALTNHPGVYAVSNRMTVSGLEFQCEFAAELPSLTNGEFLLVATDGTVVWIDNLKEPSIVRRRDGRIAVPRGFYEK